MNRKSIVLICFLVISVTLLFAQTEAFKFVVVGDSGCGCSGQSKVANRMIQWHQTNPFNVVIMLGDNIYGGGPGKRGGSKGLFAERFDKYYGPLIQAGVRFYATLGNHDLETRNGQDEIADTKRFNIGGPQGYYSFQPDVVSDERPLILFVSLNSPALIERDRSDRTQIQWLSRTLTESKAIWKVVFLHHPLYAPSGEGHEPSLDLRRDLESVFVAAGVQVVLSGHNHYYARIKTQQGITNFISGGGGRSLKTPINNDYTEKSAEILHFMSFEVFPDRMNFQVVPAEGSFSDSGTLVPTPVTTPPPKPSSGSASPQRR